MFNDLCTRLGIDVPIIGFSHCRDVVAAVSRAGGLGVLGGAGMSTEEFETALHILDKECNGAPYGVDLLFPASGDLKTTSDEQDALVLRSSIPIEYRGFEDELEARLGVPKRTNPGAICQIGGARELEFAPTLFAARDRWEAARDHNIKMLASALGPAPEDVLADARARGILVGGLVGDVKHVKHHLKTGADFIVAQGAEAGGHTGTVSTMVLVPQIVKECGTVPVLAAGGIATGAQVAASLALGAQGVWIGSLWLTTFESDLHPIVKEKLVAARSSDTVMTRSITGKPTRQLKTALVAAWMAEDAPTPLPSPFQQVLVADTIASAYEHEIDSVMGTTVGQVVGLMNGQQTVATVMNQMVNEAAEVMERLGETVRQASS